MNHISHAYRAFSLIDLSTNLNRTFEMNPNWKLVCFEIGKKDKYFEALAVFTIENRYSKSDAVNLKGLGTVTRP
jgi:hypothetical protein